MKNIIKHITLSLLLGLIIIGCGSKNPEDVTIEDVIDDMPSWYMNPKNAAGKENLCEVGSDPTRTGAILEGKENLMAMIETEVKYKAETRRNASDSAWRTQTEFRSEGLLKKSFIHKYKIGPEGNVYILLCVNKADLAWENW
jgi:hypothetical protein